MSYLTLFDGRKLHPLLAFHVGKRRKGNYNRIALRLGSSRLVQIKYVRAENNESTHEGDYLLFFNMSRLSDFRFQMLRRLSVGELHEEASPHDYDRALRYVRLDHQALCREDRIWKVFDSVRGE